MAITKHLKNTFLTISLLFFSHQSFADFIALKDFGVNPGALKASYYLPSITNNKAPALVVLLHGCAQQGEVLAQQSGLLALAKQHHFALLIPQQELANNIKRCFNWYSADDYSQDKGESSSIKNMIIHLKQQVAAEKVYLVGLSAGGAMASSLLVNYPDLFTAGAVVAGIPFPCADGLITGISCMKNGPSQTAIELTAMVKKLQPKQVKWPKLSVWTGAKDAIVNPLNSTLLAQHWAKLSATEVTAEVNKESGYTITRWQNTHQEVHVELVEIDQLSHGIMVNPKAKNGGEVSDYVLAAPISTAKHLVEFWEL